MLFKSTLLFVAAIILFSNIEDALGTHHSKSGCDGDADKDKCGTTTGVGIVPIKVGGLSAGNKPSGFSKLGLNLNDNDCDDKLDKLHFDKEKFKAFLFKVRNLFRVYASKELVPEAKEMLAKTAGFIIETVAKQKPQEMAKFNKVIQKSAKVCDDACKDGENKCKSKC